MATRNARIYLDQNLLGYIRDGKLGLSHITEIDWIYSTEHFREVARSGDPTFIQALETIDAQHLEVLLDERWRILDRAVVTSSPRPLERYFAYTKAKEAAPDDSRLFTDLLARLYGARNEVELSTLPDRVASRLSTLLVQAGFAPEDTPSTVIPVTEGLQAFIATDLSVARPLESLRKEMGVHGGRVGTFHKDPIREIWEILKCRLEGITADQFFGFDPIDKQGYNVWPRYLGIAGCHSVLNFVGYGPDEKITRTEAWPRIISDATHIACASFCDAVISEDARFIKKARAIYTYLNLPTRAYHLRFAAP